MFEKVECVTSMSVLARKGFESATYTDPAINQKIDQPLEAGALRSEKWD